MRHQRSIRARNDMQTTLLLQDADTCRNSGTCLQGYTPDPDRLPAFLLHLARDVEWDEEKPCFCTLAQTLAQFYSLQKPLEDVPRQPRPDAASSQADGAAQQAGDPAAAAAAAHADGSVSRKAQDPSMPSPASIETPDAAPKADTDANDAAVVGSDTVTQLEPTALTEEDAIEAALAAQRPHPNLSASGAITEAEVAQAIESLPDAAQLDGDGRAPEPARVAQRDSDMEQPLSADDRMTEESKAAAVAGSVADAATVLASDATQVATTASEADGERDWTIQHVRLEHVVLFTSLAPPLRPCCTSTLPNTCGGD